MPSWLDTLGKIGRKVSVGVNIAGVVAPLISGVVVAIRKIIRNDGVVEYHLVIEQGGENIDQSEADARATLEMINAERAKAGLDPLPIPD